MLSLIIPIYNEERLVNELVRRTIAAVESITTDYEVIFVDDGSTDGSLASLLKFKRGNNRIKIISLSKNFGHQAAYTAGLEFSKADIVAMMDGDLQDPPELLPEMYRKIVEEKFDIINGKRTARRGKKNRNLYSFFFHILFKNITEISEIENYGNFSMMTREAVNALMTMKEKVRYLPGMRAFIGFHQGYVEFVRDDRFVGNSKMNLKKLFSLASDAIFSFSRFPIRLCLALGTIGTFIFLLAGIYLLINKAFGFSNIDWSYTLIGIYFLGSIQLLFLGLLGEYVYRNYKESQNRPIYFVKKFYDSSSGV
jgi:glycosyltransferase involved in cell wall biosynthesis